MKKIVLVSLAMLIATPVMADSPFVFLRWEDVKPTHDRLQKNKKYRAKIVNTNKGPASVVRGPAEAWVAPRAASGMPIW